MLQMAFACQLMKLTIPRGCEQKKLDRCDPRTSPPTQTYPQGETFTTKFRHHTIFQADSLAIVSLPQKLGTYLDTSQADSLPPLKAL